MPDITDAKQADPEIQCSLPAICWLPTHLLLGHNTRSFLEREKPDL